MPKPTNSEINATTRQAAAAANAKADQDLKAENAALKAELAALKESAAPAAAPEEDAAPKKNLFQKKRDK